jgi:hypothetical protein
MITHFQIDVIDDEIIVTLPGTSYSVTYYNPDGQPHLHAKNYPVEVDPRAEMAQAEFLGKAWGIANDRARELGWVVGPRFRAP